MIVYIHSHDISDAGRAFGRHSGRDVRHVVVSEDTRPADVAARVREAFNDEERASREGLIDLLVINAHGSPGVIHIGGIEVDTNDVNIDNAEIFAQPFASLMKPTRNGGQGVEVHGCGVAAGSIDPLTGETEDGEIGFRFVYALACAFGINVKASGSPQVSDSQGLFEDSLVEAFPSDDEDWNTHVFAVNDTDSVHEGGTWTRIEAMYDDMVRSFTEHSFSEPRTPPRDPREVHRPPW